MARPIIKLAYNEYVEWSSVVDAPISDVMTSDEIFDHLKEQNPMASPTTLIDRLQRAYKHGSSYMDCRSAEEAIKGNRAGPGETELTLQEIRTRYSKKTKKPKRTYEELAELLDDCNVQVTFTGWKKELEAEEQKNKQLRDTLKTINDLIEGIRYRDMDLETELANIQGHIIEALNKDAVHKEHCYQGEYKDTCKYGAEDCTAKPKEEPKCNFCKVPCPNPWCPAKQKRK